jgi:hypothetical protein
LNHRFRLIYVFGLKKLRGQSTEDLLGRRDHTARLVNTAGNVQQTEHNPARTDTKKIVKVATLPLAVIESGKFGSVDYGDVRLQ